MKHLLKTFILLFIATVSFAQDKGLEIAKAADLADTGYESLEVNLKMELKNEINSTNYDRRKNKTSEIKNYILLIRRPTLTRRTSRTRK